MQTDPEGEEVKCVCAIDGVFFAVGNTSGKVSVYSIEPMELVKQVKLHQALIRHITTVTPK